MWKFVPFGGCARICSAQQVVLTQAIYVLVRLVQRFESIGNRDPVDEYVEFTKVTAESRNNIKIAFIPGLS